MYLEQDNINNLWINIHKCRN